MYVLDISEDVASLHQGTPPSDTGVDHGVAIHKLVALAVEHSLSVVAPYKREEDRIEEWFARMYPGRPWHDADWYLMLESRVLQPLLSKVSHFLFSIINKHPFRILEVDISPYTGQLGQQVTLTVKANIQYSDNEVVDDSQDPPDCSTDFDVVNQAVLDALRQPHNELMLSPVKLNPTLYSVADRSPCQVQVGHWSDEDPMELDAQRAQEAYRENINWVKERLVQRVRETTTSNLRHMQHMWGRTIRQ